ncbi:MAG TPA: flagellar type III secretion system pore protein FliP [Actinomycetes bacterium]|nr:flagellar type III secretion system pore protein FliP [Actinomycetes bacterium]
MLALSVLTGSAASAATAPASYAGMSAPASVVAAPVTSYGASLVAAPAAPGPSTPAEPTAPADPAATTGGGTVTVDLNGINGKPSSSIVVILAITLLSVAPALLLMTTSFTKIIVVLSLTRNALGLQNTPPNQVLAGLALFLSLFVMAPVLGQVNELGVQPYLHGTPVSVAFDDGVQPLKEFMLDHTRKDELALMSQAAHRDLPAARADVPLTTLVPAFVLSELKSAFIIGFVIFVPFLVIDIVISASLMAMGMMMLPPVVISLPFKLLLFVMVDGWGLIVTSLISSYRGGG